MRRFIRLLFLVAMLPYVVLVLIPLWKLLDWAFVKEPQPYWSDFMELFYSDPGIT